MDRFANIPAKTKLLDDALKEQLKTVLYKLTERVEIVAVLNGQDASSIELAGFLKVFCSLKDKLVLTLLDKGEDPEMEKKLGCEDYLPAFGIFVRERDFTGISFLGIPGGKELNSLVIALYNAAGPGQPLSEETKRRIEGLSPGHRLQVCVSLSCHHCAETVVACQHIAALNPSVQAQMVDARLFPAFIDRYKLERVPVLVLDGESCIVGGKSMEEVLDILENAD